MRHAYGQPQFNHRPWNYEQQILGLIARRECTRWEWHALRRWRGRRRLGRAAPELILVSACIRGDYYRAAKVADRRLRTLTHSQAYTEITRRFGFLDWQPR